MSTKVTTATRKTVAYLRVSTLDQDLEKNKADILNFANHRDLGKVNFVEEIASGRKPWRERQIAQVLEELQSGDAIIVAELSRLGRSMLECMEILALATRNDAHGAPCDGGCAGAARAGRIFPRRANRRGPSRRGPSAGPPCSTRRAAGA